MAVAVAAAEAEAEGVPWYEGAADPPDPPDPPDARDALGQAVTEPVPPPAPLPAASEGTTDEDWFGPAGEMLVVGAADAPPLPTTLGTCGDRLPVGPGAAGPTGR